MLTSGLQNGRGCERWSSFINRSPLRGPPPRKAAPPARQRRAGSWGRRTASLSPTPARPLAPLPAFGGKARANNRGLAGIIFRRMLYKVYEVSSNKHYSNKLKTHACEESNGAPLHFNRGILTCLIFRAGKTGISQAEVYIHLI